MKQPEALRLADALETGAYLLSVERDATAAELRRLHAIEDEHVKLCGDYQDTWSSRDRLHAENQQLRDAFEQQTAGHQKTLDEWRIADQDVRRLRSAVYKLHAAKGRYHTQLAACDLYDLCDLKNERPTK